MCRNNSDDYFYLDFRDDRYGGYHLIGGYVGHWIDIWIKYDAASRFYYYSNDGSENWTQITSVESPHPTLSIWDIKQMGNPTRNRFQPTTLTNLHYENSSGHPHLIWNLSEPQEAATYEV